MSSFLGQNIEIQLSSGGALRGKITSIDASSGSLSIQRPDHTSVVVKRAEIADLKMLPPPPTSAPAPAPDQFKDPAIISYKHDTKKAMEKLSLQPAAPHSPLPIPRAPAAMIATNSDTGSSGKPRRATKVKAKKNGATSHDVGTSSRTQTEDETDYAFSGKKNMSKSRKKNQQQQKASNGGQSDLEEDFDFDKALKSFDKRKIWQEIKTTDQTDPKTLLVSHNRLKGSNAETDRGRFNGRSAQDKLGLREPVLSPSPTASHSSLSPSVGEEKVVHMQAREKASLLQGGTDMLDAELQRVRGNALQQEMENVRLKGEIRRLKEKARVLEALGGVELEMHSDDVDGHKWKCVIYESLSAHAESRRSSTKSSPGSVTFLLKTTQEETSKMRYLGVVQEQSDAAVLDRLPPQYIKEMGLKAESASIFIRRIKDAVQSK